ncbi:MAG: hypothetical protein IPP35_10175 [Elusimicrobia bacterium]|nr:hypothetical protein [Elusimicrobiota bacterium]
MNKTLKLWFLGGLAILAGRGWAVDQYVITGPSVVMVADSDVSISLEPREKGEPDATPHRVKFVGLPAGLTITPDNPADGSPVQGPTRFFLSFNATVTPGPFVLKVRKSDNARVLGQKAVNLERSVARFSLTPLARPFVGVVGQPFELQIIARDATGAVVTSFKGDVDLKAVSGDLDGGSVTGDKFEKGIATVTVRFLGGDPTAQFNRLSARARTIYSGQQEPATGQLDLAVRTAEPAP